ncbi:MFS transporter [Nocardia puris]|uniref:hypothetical protein n=1 Tax=Nocardia puris TaxID=208602 RepID=UPI000AA887A6
MLTLGLFVYGAGVGFATGQVTNVVLAEVPGERSGQGSGIQSAVRELGSAVGIALLTTVFFSVLSGGLDDRFDGDPAAAEMTRAITDSAGAAIPGLAADPATAAAADAGRDAMSSAITVTSLLCTGLLLLARAATVTLRRAKEAVPA